MVQQHLTEKQKALLFKIVNFDKIIEEYKSLKSYRNSLAGTILSNFECMNNESSVDKKNDPESIRCIENEIANTDIIISFIDSIVFGQQTTRDSDEFITTNEPK